MAFARICFLLPLLILVVCGGSTTAPIGDARDAGGSDGAASDATTTTDGAGPTDSGGGDPDAASGCVHLPAAGSPCVPGQVSCDRVDLCCASAAQCDPATKTWKLSGNSCLLCSTHGCGDKTCSGVQMCVAHTPGVPGGQVTYECAPYPTACVREWTCACVGMNLPAGCTMAVNGCNDAELPVKLSCMGI